MAPGTDIFLETKVYSDGALSSDTLFTEHNLLRSAAVREKCLRQQNKLSVKSSPNVRDWSLSLPGYPPSTPDNLLNFIHLLCPQNAVVCSTCCSHSGFEKTLFNCLLPTTSQVCTGSFAEIKSAIVWSCGFIEKMENAATLSTTCWKMGRVKHPCKMKQLLKIADVADSRADSGQEKYVLGAQGTITYFKMWIICLMGTVLIDAVSY